MKQALSNLSQDHELFYELLEETEKQKVLFNTLVDLYNSIDKANFGMVVQHIYKLKGAFIYLAAPRLDALCC